MAERHPQSAARLSEDIGDVLSTIRRLIAEDEALSTARDRLHATRAAAARATAPDPAPISALPSCGVIEDDTGEFLARRYGGNAALARRLASRLAVADVPGGATAPCAATSAEPEWPLGERANAPGAARPAVAPLRLDTPAEPSPAERFAALLDDEDAFAEAFELKARQAEPVAPAEPQPPVPDDQAPVVLPPFMAAHRPAVQAAPAAPTPPVARSSGGTPAAEAAAGPRPVLASPWGGDAGAEIRAGAAVARRRGGFALGHWPRTAETPPPVAPQISAAPEITAAPPAAPQHPAYRHSGPQGVATERMAAPPDQWTAAADPEMPPAGAVSAGAAEIAALSDVGLRDLLREMIQEELHGELGERFSRNLRSVIRREVAAAIDDQLDRF